MAYRAAWTPGSIFHEEADVKRTFDAFDMILAVIAIGAIVILVAVICVAVVRV